VRKPGSWLCRALSLLGEYVDLSGKREDYHEYRTVWVVASDLFALRDLLLRALRECGVPSRCRCGGRLRVKEVFSRGIRLECPDCGETHTERF